MEANKVERKLILLHKEDNTVTALVDLKKDEGLVIDSGASEEQIILRQNIPYAHKFARVFIPRGEDVKKYGEVIGVATADIHPGDHVHVHNVDSKRARSEPS
jgi:altronate dehydratase small subunit